MSKRHKHADLIHAWAEGEQVQIKWNGKWINRYFDAWSECFEFRLKPNENEWWKNIPNHGALCKYVTDEGLTDGSIRVFYSKPINAKNWVLLSNEEIEVFLNDDSTN